MRYKPSIPDNIKHWQVFEDVQQLWCFLELAEEFSTTRIDQDGISRTPEDIEDEEPRQNDDDDVSQTSFLNQIVGHKMLQLKSNYIPKGLVPLEQLFDRNDIPVKPTVQPKAENVEERNLRTILEHQLVKLSNNLLDQEKHKYLELFKEFKDVFT